MEPIEAAIDHVRGAGGHLIVEYGDYECPYSRQAYREIQRVTRRLGSRGLTFAFRHYPLTDIHPHAMAAAVAAEAASLQGKFWEMHDTLYHNQSALEPDDLSGYAADMGLDLARFERARTSDAVLERVRRDIASGDASGDVLGTPTLYIDGVVHRGDYDVATLMEVLGR